MEELDIQEAIELLEYLENPSAILMEMANVRGIDFVHTQNLPFSFYFSTKSAVHRSHAIRLKVLWNPSKAPASADGYMEMHGDYAYTVSSHKYKPTNKELSILKTFCLKYKVLFCAVWEEKLYDMDLVDYFRGRLQLNELLTKFDDISEKHYYLINHCKSIEELEKCVRDNKIFNMND